jgi:hypothetical protein
MNHYFQLAKSYVVGHKKAFITGAIVASVIAVLVVLFVLITVTNPSRIIYQPVKACDLLTPAKAQDLLGEKVISVDTNAPVVSDNIAVSKCSYTDSNPVQEKMMVVAIAVRSGTNDEGVEQNKKDFAAKKPTSGVEAVKDVGDSAYFDPRVGQLNILDGRQWIILSYGVGSTPEANNADKAVELAHKVLH